MKRSKLALSKAIESGDTDLGEGQGWAEEELCRGGEGFGVWESPFVALCLVGMRMAGAA